MNCERLLSLVRAHPALWGDLGEKKAAQASRIIGKLKARLRPVWAERQAQHEHARGQRILKTWE